MAEHDSSDSGRTRRIRFITEYEKAHQITRHPLNEQREDLIEKRRRRAEQHRNSIDPQ